MALALETGLRLLARHWPHVPGRAVCRIKPGGRHGAGSGDGRRLLLSPARQASTRCRLWGRGRASRNTSGRSQRAGSGPSSRLRAPQHPPPPPACTGPGTRGQARGSRWAKPSGAGGRLGLPSGPAPRGGSGDSGPGPRRLRSLASPPRPSHEAAFPSKSRASRAEPPSPLPTATATKWRTREKRPGPSPWARRPPSAHARGRARPPPRGPPLDVSGRSQSGVRSRGVRPGAARAGSRVPGGGPGGRGGGGPGPSWAAERQSGPCRCHRASAAAGTPALSKNTAGARRERRFENRFLGTKRNALAEGLAGEAWPSGDCEPEGPDQSSQGEGTIQ